MLTRCPTCHTISPVEDVKVNDIKNNEYIQSQLQEIENRKEYLKKAKDDVYRKIRTTTKAVNIGFIMERIIPALEQFQWKHSDCRSTGGDPIDYIIFEGLTDGEVKKIIFVDVKTGNANLTNRQKEIRDVINIQKNVKFRRF